MSLLQGRNLVAFVPTDNLASAKEFYKYVLGLRLVSEDDVALVFDTHSSLLRVIKISGIQPAHYTVVGWVVPDIDLVVDELDRAGVVFERYEGFVQDSYGIWTTPKGAKVAWFKDPYGNILSLTQLS
jgi:catechol 2,3-dioxygenase-like lactoylglutathione lyase family enzyme